MQMRRCLAAILGAAAAIGSASSASAQTAYGDFSLMYMMRGPLEPRSLITTEVGGSTTLDIAHTDDLHFGWSPGASGRIGLLTGGNIVGFEVGGFYLQPFSAETDPFPCNYMTVQFEFDTLEFNCPNTEDAWDLSVAGQTTVRGLDANIVLALSHGFSLFGGAAHIGLHDTLALISDGSPTIVETWDWDVWNRLTGAQIGARLTVGGNAGSPLVLNAEARVGYLRNQVDAQYTYTHSNIGPFGPYGVMETTQAWLFGGKVDVGFSLADRLSFGVGYEVLLLRGVALAADQLPLTSSYSLNGVAFGSFWTHGVRASMTLAY